VLRSALIAGGLVLGSNGAYYAFASLYWASHGFSAGVIGALFAFSVVAEVALFWAAKLLPGWGARRFLILAAVGALVRWLLFPFATTPAAALVLQALHALTFGAAHLGVMMAIGAVGVPGHTARLQGVHQLVSGFSLAVATLAAGPLYRLSPASAFIAMALVAAPGLFLALRLRPGLQPQSAALGGSTVAPE
jgi:PPP family 3-phenylpropionic acid transporter